MMNEYFWEIIVFWIEFLKTFSLLNLPYRFSTIRDCVECVCNYNEGQCYNDFLLIRSKEKVTSHQDILTGICNWVSWSRRENNFSSMDLGDFPQNVKKHIKFRSQNNFFCVLALHILRISLRENTDCWIQRSIWWVWQGELSSACYI